MIDEDQLRVDTFGILLDKSTASFDASNYPPFPIKLPNWLQAHPGHVPELCLSGISDLNPPSLLKIRVPDEVANTRNMRIE